MKILYIFPHPDDESFGPAGAIHQKMSDGHEAHLLKLTRGGATQVRFKLEYSGEEMGDLRLREMHKVKEVLKLTSMTVLDFPDNGLKELDPRNLEKAVANHILEVQPDIVVTYPVHGGGGFTIISSVCNSKTRLPRAERDQRTISKAPRIFHNA